MLRQAQHDDKQLACHPELVEGFVNTLKKTSRKCNEHFGEVIKSYEVAHVYFTSGS